MGSGFSGKYQGTWSSPEGEELRAKVLAAIEQAGGMLVGDSVVDLAEALVRIAAGESADDEVDFPEMSDVALDLALDALSAFMPGGAAATRSLSLAVKAGRGVTKTKGGKVVEQVKRILNDESGYLELPPGMRFSEQEHAIVNSRLNEAYHARLEGRGRREIDIGEYAYTVESIDFDEHKIFKRKRIR